MGVLACWSCCTKELQKQAVQCQANTVPPSIWFNGCLEGAREQVVVFPQHSISLRRDDQRNPDVHPPNRLSMNRSLGNGVRKNGVRNRVRIDDVGLILKFTMGFPFGETSSADFCMSV